MQGTFTLDFDERNQRAYEKAMRSATLPLEPPNGTFRLDEHEELKLAMAIRSVTLPLEHPDACHRVFVELTTKIALVGLSLIHISRCRRRG